MANVYQQQQHPSYNPYQNGSRSPAPLMSSQNSSGSMATSSSTPKPPDYVYFDRTAAGFSAEAVPRAKAAHLKLEHFYKVAVDSAIERNQRYVGGDLASTKVEGLMRPRINRRVELERRLQTDNTMTDERKQRQLQQLGKKESTFLRLRRTKLGLDDFRTVKVIGKGAFGEVRRSRGISLLALKHPSSGRYDWCKRRILVKYTP